MVCNVFRNAHMHHHPSPARSPVQTKPQTTGRTVKVRFTGTAKGMSDEHVDVKDLLDVNEDTMRLKKVRLTLDACVSLSLLLPVQVAKHHLFPVLQMFLLADM